jgi:hypothetical protein
MKAVKALQEAIERIETLEAKVLPSLLLKRVVPFSTDPSQTLIMW